MLKQMRERGEIDEEQYEALRRHVLWGTPLPDLLADKLPVSAPEDEAPGPVRADEQRPSAQRFSPNLGPATGEQPQRSVPPRRRPGPPPRGPAYSRPGPPPVQPAGPPAASPPAGLPPAGPAPDPTAAGRSGHTRLLIAVTAAFVVIVAGATAGWWYLLRDDDGVTPAQYAAAICPGIAGWHSDIRSAGDGLPDQLAATDDLAAQQRIAARYYTGAAERTDALLPELERATAPDGSSGERYADELTRAVRTADGRFHNLAAQVNELEPAGEATFKAALTILTSHPEAPTDGVTALLAEGRPPGDIDDALASESTCQDLR